MLNRRQDLGDTEAWQHVNEVFLPRTILYLRARGLSEPQARHLLVRAFASEVVNQMPFEPLRARIDDEVARRLPGGRS